VTTAGARKTSPKKAPHGVCKQARRGYTVKQGRVGVDIFFERSTEKGPPFWVALTVAEAARLVADLAHAIQVRTLDD
jgi:hypothetical protein